MSTNYTNYTKASPDNPFNGGFRVAAEIDEKAEAFLIDPFKKSAAHFTIDLKDSSLDGVTFIAEQ